MNIFELSQELLSIYQEIEDNDGELTPSLSEKLDLTKDDFDTKIKSYVNLSKLINNDIESIDKELQRLQDLKKSKQKTEERINEIIIKAVNNFGDCNKSGNRFYDYGTGKVSIRKTKAIESNKDYNDMVSKKIEAYIKALKYENLLDTVDNINDSEFIDFCNSQTHFSSENIPDTSPIVVNYSDLESIKTSINVDLSLDKLLNNDGYKLLKAALENNEFFKIKVDINKTKAKSDIENDIELNSCKLITNEHLSFK